MQKKLLITNDICLKCLLKKYGGKGYGHVIKNVVPYLMKAGVSSEILMKTILTDNPAKLLDKKTAK